MDLDLFSIFNLSVRLILIFSFVNSTLLFTKMKNFDRPLKLLTVYLICSFIINVISFIIAYNGQNNLYLLHFYTLAEVTFLSYIFYLISETFYSKHKSWYTVVIVIIAMSIILSTYYLKDVVEFNSVGTTVSSITLIVLTISYFKMQLDKNELYNNVEHVTRVIIVMIFINHSVSLIIFLFSNKLMTDLSIDNQFTIWIIRNLVTLATYIFLSYSIWIRLIQKNPQEQSVKHGRL